MTSEQLFKSLKIPDNVFNPLNVFSGKKIGDWNIVLSPRALGKTTNFLLWGMCENQVNGTVIQYIRQYDDMLTPSMVNDLFDVILKFGYIEKITGGKYNSCRYWRRRWYYTKIDENGTEVEKAPEAFAVCLAINREHDLRSTYNAPKGDFIIVDEFMRADKMYIRDEFVLLNNLLSTIIRDRTTARIFMLANLVDITCPYLVEMGIHEIVKGMNFGDFQQLKSDKTTLSIYLIPPNKEKQKKLNKYFSLWQNSKLTGITGAAGTWALKMYPHAPHAPYTLVDKAQIQCKDGFICREIRKYETGLYLMFYPLSEPLENKVTYTHDEKEGFTHIRRYHLGGYTDTDKIVSKLIQLKKWYFSDNTTGERIESYIKGR